MLLQCENIWGLSFKGQFWIAESPTAIFSIFKGFGQIRTWVTGSFMTRTSVTVPNWPKYSRSFSGVVCQDSPPTKSFPGAESEPDPGVDRPDEEPFWLVPEPPLPGATTVEPGTDPADPTTPVPSLPTAKREIFSWFDIWAWCKACKVLIDLFLFSGKSEFCDEWYNEQREIWLRAPNFLRFRVRSHNFHPPGAVR